MVSCHNWGHFPCCLVDKEILYWLAALVWVIGILATGETGSKLLVDAQERYGSEQLWIVWLSWALSGTIGLILAYVLFVPILKRNLARILALEQPHIHEFFRMRFWFMLIFFDGGIFVVTEYCAKDRLSHALIGALDFSVCISLTVSGFLYFTEWESFRQKCIENRTEVDGVIGTANDRLRTDLDSSSALSIFPDTL